MNFRNVSKFRGKNILVAGLGKSGISTVKKLAGFAGRIIAVDSNPYLEIGNKFDSLKGLKNSSLEVVISKSVNRSRKILDNVDLVIISPGISNEIPLARHADRLKIPVWSEIELGWRLLAAPERKNTIAVTGTNGKTTVVSLLQKIFSDAGISAVACGNIGNPLIDTVGGKNPEKLVRIMEISSFQLERTCNFSPFIGIILNITSDHLDRHHSMDNYAEIKFNLFKFASARNWGIFNLDDFYIRKKLLEKNYFKATGLKIAGYSLEEDSAAEIRKKGNAVFCSLKRKSGLIDISKIPLAGIHNISNIMSAFAASKIMGIDDSSIERTLKKFRTLEHRIEFVAELDGVRVYNDSKATNPDATIKALESFEREITLILGGKDKDMDFNILLPYMDKKVVNLILIGETRIKILKMLEHQARESSEGLPYNVFVCDTFQEAVDKGMQITDKGKVLLLSPACASFDMFRDYKDRGDIFKRIITGKKKKS